jgi:hypothetical protein
VAFESNGAIYGIVSEDGVIKEGCPVVLLRHSGLQVIAETITDVNGGYIFNNLDPDSTDYMVLTVDNDGASPKSALVIDYVQPNQTSNGILAGNFMSTLDSMAADLSLVTMYHSGTSNGLAFTDTKIVRMNGGGLDGAANNDYATLSNFRSDLTPVPTAAGRIIGSDVMANICGWLCGPLNWIFWDNQGACLPRASAQQALSFMVFHRVTTNAATYSVTYHHAGDALDSSWRNRALTSHEFSATTANYYSRDTHFNLCIEANGEVRIKYLVSSGTSPTRKNFLITTLSNASNKFYMFIVRYSAVTTEFIYVDIVDTTTGIKTSYNTGVARGTMHQGTEYGSVQGAGPMRHGIMVCGAHDISSGTFNIWDSTNGYSWSSQGRWTNATKAEFGPLAYWNRKITDSEITNLVKAACDTTTTWRSYPRYLSEIMANGPSLWIPNDEYPGEWTRNQKQAHKRKVRSLGRSNSTKRNLYSARRRRVIQWGGAMIIESVAPQHHLRSTIMLTVKRNTTVAAVLYSNDTLNYTTNYQTNEYSLAPTANLQRIVYVQMKTDGYLRFYWQNSSLAVQDMNFTLGNIAIGETAHVVFVLDPYTGLACRLYTNGVFRQSKTTTQMSGLSLVNGIDSYCGSQTRLTVNADGYQDGLAYSGRDIDSDTGCTVADIVIFPSMLSDADILELYNAWAICYGTDSQA